MLNSIKSGIYAIRNTYNGKMYIGSSINIKKRLISHKCNLRKGLHANKRLQRSYSKYGESSFEFCIIENVSDINNLLKREQEWIDKLKLCDEKHGFNIRPLVNNNLGFRHSEDTKRKLKKIVTGVKRSPESIEKSVMTRRENGSFIKSQETREKISQAGKGRVVSEETRKKLSAVKKGKKHSVEWTKNNALARTGAKRSNESRYKMSLPGRGRKLSKESIEKREATRRANREAKKQADIIISQLSIGTNNVTTPQTASA